MIAQTMLAILWSDVAGFFLHARFLGNSLTQWLGVLGVLLASFVAGKIISFCMERQARRLSEKAAAVAMVLKSLSRPVTLLALGGGLYVAQLFLTLEMAGKSFRVTWLDFCRTLAVLAAGWSMYRLVDVLEHYLRRWTSKTETLLDDQLVPLVRKTLRVFVVIVAVLFLAQNIFKWDVAALLAGLGIGGLAMALAAKDTLANLFGSVTIFADRPFHMGDRVIISGQDGFVEEVGFRSTRLRLLSGNLLVVPNATVAAEAIENVSQRPAIKRVLDVTVTYDTAPEKLQQGVEIIREMLEARTASFLPDKPPQVFFSDFNAASLNIVVYYWFTPPDWWEYLAFNHDFNMELLRRYNEAGIEFAFPTQTLYVKQDSPLEAQVQIKQRGQGDVRRGEAYT